MAEFIPFFIVASVEVGNTTTKCILTATNMKDGRTRLLNKTVKMTRDVRKPKPQERIFGTTLSGVSLTRESISELVRDTLLEAHEAVNLDITTDLDFAVRSTGVVAGFSSPHEVGEFIKALADGCLNAGIPPKKMVPAMSIENIPIKFKDHTLIDKVIFTGAVGGVLPPAGSTGVEIVANEMEGELSTAGIKEGAKWAGVDFRNPVFSMDFGTTLKGRITNADIPYARTIANLCGFAGAVHDAVIKGTGLVDKRYGAALDLFRDNKERMIWLTKSGTIQKYTKAIHELISIEIVPDDRNRYGSVPVDPAAARDIGVMLIGCDVGMNGSLMPELTNIGSEIYSEHGLKTMFATLDLVSAMMVERLVKLAFDNKLVTEKASIGLTGRAAITGCKPHLILKAIENLGIFRESRDHVVFVDDGLARGAAVMARCMNSMGVPGNPIGGVRGGGCVLSKRIEYYKKSMEKKNT
ncbi:MAG TPA: methanogenesis marker 14 protein [Candidatus Methanoperedens sp.]|nr:methanogenesis marker 14 protein [Candidatus Methanoperedens sp.]HLB69770.1 methanogenesis marker 14 protein [Candidatus Methanoperedens sp.]